MCVCVWFVCPVCVCVCVWFVCPVRVCVWFVCPVCVHARDRLVVVREQHVQLTLSFVWLERYLERARHEIL